MTIMESIKQLKEQNLPEQEIIQQLRGQNFSENEISEALSQTEIKQAVSGGPQVPQTPEAEQAPAPADQVPPPAPQTQQAQQPFPKDATTQASGQEQLQPSMMSQDQIQPPAQEQAPQVQQAPDQQVYAEAPQYPGYQQGQEQYAQGQYPQQNTDTINEIAEQVVTEKLSDIRQKLEKTIDLKDSFETSIDSVEGRLIRLERIIDNLQASILQKVGQSMSNIDDIKNEMIETQKSFKAASRSKKSKHKK